MLLGCICLACGYFPLHNAYQAGGKGYSFSSLCFFGFLTGVGSCSAFIASLKVCATNWPRHRGTARAFPLSGFGLSALLFLTVSGFAFPDDTAGLLLLLAIGTFCMVFTGMIFLQMITPRSSYEAAPADERPGYKRSDSNRMHRTHSEHRRQGSRNSGYNDGGTKSKMYYHATGTYTDFTPYRTLRRLFPRVRRPLGPRRSQAVTRPPILR